MNSVRKEKTKFTTVAPKHAFIFTKAIAKTSK